MLLGAARKDSRLPKPSTAMQQVVQTQPQQPERSQAAEVQGPAGSAAPKLPRPGHQQAPADSAGNQRLPPGPALARWKPPAQSGKPPLPPSAAPRPADPSLPGRQSSLKPQPAPLQHERAAALAFQPSTGCCVQPASAGPVQRQVSCMDEFSTVAEYSRHWELAMFEELNLRRATCSMFARPSIACHSVQIAVRVELQLPVLCAG